MAPAVLQKGINVRDLDRNKIWDVVDGREVEFRVSGMIDTGVLAEYRSSIPAC